MRKDWDKEYVMQSFMNFEVYSFKIHEGKWEILNEASQGVMGMHYHLFQGY